MSGWEALVKCAGARASVLLVEGHSARRLSLEATLAPLGVRCVHAGSAEEALAQHLHEDFVLLLLGVPAGWEEGRHAVRLLGEACRPRATPLLLLLRELDAEHVREAHLLGAVDCLPREPDPDVLRARVSVFVELHVRTEALRQAHAALTEREQGLRLALEASEHKRAFLSEASRLLGESREPEDILRRLARFAASSVATYCLVDLLQEEGGLRRAALAHQDPLQAELVERLWRLTRSGHSSSLVAETLRQGQAQLYANFSTELRQRAAISPEHDALMVRLDPRSVLLVPMQAGGRPWGVLTLVRAGGAIPFDARDLDMAEELARRAAVALENAWLLSTTRDAVRRRDEFLSVASHELKTPLTPLSLRLQALARVMEAGGFATLERRLPDDVAVMRQQVKRLSDLMNELLEVSRISAGPLPLTLEPVELVTLVRDGVDRLAATARRAGCLIELQGEGPIVGQWDRRRLEQVVSQLLYNALKYGAGKPILIQVGSEGTHAWLVIRDQGIGIEPWALPRLFEKFERAVSVHNYGGLGLGLYITRRIVESLGGTIGVESSPGQGATFTARLPRARPDALAPKPLSS